MAYIKIKSDREGSYVPHIHGFYIVPEQRKKGGVEASGYYDLALDFTPESGKDYFLLYVAYTTGDSFGRDPTVRMVYLDLSADLKTAQENGRRVRAYDRRQAKWPPTVKLLRADGSIWDCSAMEWTDYFSHIEEIAAVRVRMVGDDGTKWTF